MGFFGKVLGGISHIAGVVSKIADIIQKPLSLITSPLKGLADKFLDKLGPFGKFLKPLADKFLDNAASFLMPGGLGVLSTIMKGASTVGKIADAVGTLSTAAQGDPASLANLAQLAAQRQAQIAA